ncbi:hypothetical protein [Nocardiopsis sp. JB363]|uniref:hypothetical protein n=1 Tax=Nocardiopsis sp. JB363 TaxID=1434837 RepID=UPI000B34B9D5|nr:hypothetical protein [Nocardiopsis sp. JB363]
MQPKRPRLRYLLFGLVGLGWHVAMFVIDPSFTSRTLTLAMHLPLWLFILIGAILSYRFELAQYRAHQAASPSEDESAP